MSNDPTKKTGISLRRETHVLLSGFVILGTLPGLLGPLLILWQYHLESDLRVLGWMAVILNASCLFGVLAGGWRTRSYLVTACVLCAAGFIALAYAAPPAPVLLRFAALVLLGVPAGGMAARISWQTSLTLHAAPAAVVNACGVYFGGGALLATLSLDGAYTAGMPDMGPGMLALLPVIYLFLAWKMPDFQRAKEIRVTPSPRPRAVRPLATALLTILVFVQFGNEWALAVWLPFFLIRTFGASPAVAMSLLAIHFLFLMIGRWVSRALLPAVNHRRFLVAGIVLSIGSYLVLFTAASLGVATTAVILIGLAQGPVSPIAAEKLDEQLPFASGRRILYAAVCGALVEPWLAAYVCSLAGVQQTMLVPAFGAVAACVLGLLILLESKLMGSKVESQESDLLP